MARTSGGKTVNRYQEGETLMMKRELKEKSLISRRGLLSYVNIFLLFVYFSFPLEYLIVKTVEKAIEISPSIVGQDEVN